MQPGVPMQPQQPSNAGKGLATASMVFGIIGIVLASMSKKRGFDGGVRTAGLVLSILSLVVGSIVFIACVACAGAAGAGIAGLNSIGNSMSN